MGYIVAVYHEIRAACIDAADDDMAVWIVGIPMVDRDPVELRAKIHLHPCHEIAGEAAKVFDVLRVLGGDDETELVAIALDARSEERRVGKEWVSTCRSRWSPY